MKSELAIEDKKGRKKHDKSLPFWIKHSQQGGKGHVKGDESKEVSEGNRNNLIGHDNGRRNSILCSGARPDPAPEGKDRWRETLDTIAKGPGVGA